MNCYPLSVFTVVRGGRGISLISLQAVQDLNIEGFIGRSLDDAAWWEQGYGIALDRNAGITKGHTEIKAIWIVEMRSKIGPRVLRGHQ